jgi:hypothetical protein
VARHMVAIGSTLRLNIGSCCQGSRSCSRSLLHRPSVVALVPCQRSSSGKCLLAVGIRALVGSLARVDSSMAR